MTDKSEQELQRLVRNLKSENKKLIEDHKNELLKLNDDHMDRMFEERERHSHLYSIEAKMFNTERKLGEQQRVIARQEGEINWQLYRISRYAPKELSQYPKQHLKNGVPDALIWEFTREARKYDQIIQDLKDEMTKLKQDHIKILQENLSMKTFMDAHKECSKAEDKEPIAKKSLVQDQSPMNNSTGNQNANGQPGTKPYTQIKPDTHDQVYDFVIDQWQSKDEVVKFHQMFFDIKDQVFQPNQNRVSFDNSQINASTEQTTLDNNGMDKTPNVENLNIDFNKYLQILIAVAEKYGQTIVWENDKAVIKTVYQFDPQFKRFRFKPKTQQKEQIKDSDKDEMK